MVGAGEEARVAIIGWCGGGCLADSGTWRISADSVQGLGLTCSVRCRHECAALHVMLHGTDDGCIGNLSFMFARMLWLQVAVV